MTEQIQSLIETINALKKEVSDLKNLNSVPDREELLTRQEVANYLKIDLSTLHHWTKRGKLIRYGIGKRVYYKRSEIENAVIEIQTLNS